MSKQVSEWPHSVLAWEKQEQCSYHKEIRFPRNTPKSRYFLFSGRHFKLSRSHQYKDHDKSSASSSKYRLVLKPAEFFPFTHLQTNHGVGAKSINRIQPQIAVEILGIETRQWQAITVTRLYTRHNSIRTCDQHDTQLTRRSIVENGRSFFKVTSKRFKDMNVDNMRSKYEYINIKSNWTQKLQRVALTAVTPQ